MRDKNAPAFQDVRDCSIEEILHMYGDGSINRYERDRAIQFCSACNCWVLRIGENERDFPVCWTDGIIALCKCMTCLCEGRRISPHPSEMMEGIPAAYAMASMFSLPSLIKDALRAWPDRIRHMAISGQIGCGKTFAAWARLKELRRGAMMNMTEFRRDWSNATDGRARLEDRLATAPMAVLDEFTTVEPSAAWVEMLHARLSARLANGRPTLLLSHHPMAEIVEWYGPVIGSRLREFTGILYSGKDRRKAARVPTFLDEA